MKLLLLASVICFAAVLAAPADKQKREILPGDPRYGTDYHHHHHENEVQISKAIGGYVGSFSVPDTEVQKDSFQVPKPTYGPPSHKPGNLINGDHVVVDNIKDSIHQVPATSYGIPDTTQLNNNYLSPAIEDKTTLLKVTVPKTDVHLNTDLHTDYQAPSAEAPITSYGLPDIKTISEQQKYDTVLKSNVGVVPQVTVKTKLPETQGFTQHSINTGSLPSFTTFNSGSSLLPSAYSSYPTSYVGNYQSHSSIPVKTVDHHVQVQVPQPYPVPVTKHVSYRVPVPHTVEVPKPYHVRVPYPVQVPVNRPYPVEVPRAVPYPVPQYIRTNVPVAVPVPVAHPQPQLHLQQHHVVKANPGQTFFDNIASTFQDTIGNLPNFPQFSNPLQNFPNLQNPFGQFPNIQNPFENFQLPSLPSFPSLTPSQPTQAPTAPAVPEAPIVTSNDAVTVDNPTIKTTITKTNVFAPVTPVAAGTVLKTTQKEYVQQTDANGGYIY